jgi:hypothetical protein
MVPQPDSTVRIRSNMSIMEWADRRARLMKRL